MASMVKEKRRNKRKGKEKQSDKHVEINTSDVETQDCPTSVIFKEAQSLSVNSGGQESRSTSSGNQEGHVNSDSSEKRIDLKCSENEHSENPASLLVAGSNSKMEDNTVIPENFDSAINLQSELIPTVDRVLEDIRPSAPLLEEKEPIKYISQCKNIEQNIKIRIPCMSMEQAIRLFGAKEIAEVNAISVKQEAIVEAGPQSGSDHPLVDLLSTFRTSLIAIEREQNCISRGFIEEEGSRATLWKVNKRTLNISKKCPCGSNVSLKVTFDVAKLQKEKLPAARMKLESLLRDVQESYCHHQHAAMQAYYDIDELLSEVLQSGKEQVREALLLVLQALRLSDTAPEALAQALQRWAGILSAALLDGRDLGHLLFLLHSIFRQTRSVQWAARVLRLPLSDTASAARLLGLLELLLARPPLEEALECTEAESESWEEVGRGGEGGAVREGRLRERDLLALLDALPLPDMLARLLLFTRTDITKETDDSWGDRSGGQAVLKASCGVRVLLSVLQRALSVHCTYTRLRTKLQQLAVAALEALAELHQHSRQGYSQELEERVAVELEACFAAGLGVLGAAAARPPASLLAGDVAKDYCNTLIAGLHDPAPLHVESLRAQCVLVACASRVRAAARAVLDRELDHELATFVLEFLFEVGIKRQSIVCKGACDVAARDLMPEIVTLPGMHAVAFRILADLSRVEAIEPALLVPLAPQRWRPAPGEAWAVLHDWGERCDRLVPHLLLSLDYTPHTGVSLESQVCIGKWVCAWLRARGEQPEWAWRVLRALRVHRSQWALPLDTPSLEPALEPADYLLSAAFALLAGDWGHSVPLVCGPGACALLRLARARAADAALCAGLVMRVMALSPESVSLTPTFTEVFAAILSSGPNLVQRALGRRALGGQEALQRALADSLRDTTGPCRGALVSAWLRALWQPALPDAARALLDHALRIGRDWRALDDHAALMLQGENAREYITDAVRNVGHAPLLCEALLRRAHALEARSQWGARLPARLAAQRAAGQRAHVDNALKEAGSMLSADELAIHRCAGAVLAAGWQHPAHLLLWRLFLQVFLQRLPASPNKDTHLPVGILFFSGLVKSRTLSQLKKRLQETAAYHRAQAEALKAKVVNPVSSGAPAKVEKPSPPADDNLFRTLAILDLTGTDESETDSDEDVSGDIKATETADPDRNNLIGYHLAAEKVLREYLLWLDQGEAVRALPHHADLSRFLPEQVLDTAWRASLGEPPLPAGPPSAPPCPPAPAPRAFATHCERAVRAVLSVKSKRRRRCKIPTLPASKVNSCLNDSRAFVEMVRSHLNELEKLTRQWVSDVERVSQLDGQLWELVGRLRARRPLPPVRRACVRRCEPLTVHVAEEEWCVSEGAERAVRENRRNARAAVRQLSRARAHDARVASRLRAACRQVRSKQLALSVAELALEAAPRTHAYAPARDTVCALITDLAARLLSADGRLVAEQLARWGGAGPARHALCLALLGPARPPAAQRAPYVAVLRLRAAPHLAFSYLSKFDLSAWGDAVDTDERTLVLEELVLAACRLGPQPDKQQMVLLELLGVHSSCAVRPQELCGHVLRCGRACVAGTLPAAYLAHLPGVVTRHGGRLDFDELGHVLRQLGMVWWEAHQAAASLRPLYAEYAPHFADTLYSLTREFVAAAVRRTYQPERVGLCAWSVLLEAWSAWAWPQRATPLLGAGPGGRVLARFGDTVRIAMQDCPGSEDVVLRQVFQWAAQTGLGEDERWPQDSRGQLAALLRELAALPWQRQWFHVDLLHLVLQVSRLSEQELTSWCSERLKHQQPESWLCGVSDNQLAPTLSALLEIFTSKYMNFPPETLCAGVALPWARLPEPALGAALERYFCDHHSPAQPYHHASHFRVMLSACHLVASGDARPPTSPQAAAKRAAAVSHWTRAAAAPALGAHVQDFSADLLDTLTNLAPHIEESPGELEQLLSRGVVILCMEPAAAAALPVWQKWVGGCPPRLRCACAGAVATLTTVDYFAALGDAVAKAILAETDGGGWAVLRARWAHCPWAAGAALAARGALHAAYGMLLARPDADCLVQALHALLDADFNFASNDVIIAVWICVAARAALAARASEHESGGHQSASREAGGLAARTLLARWAEQRRTLLQVVTLHSADRWPTAQHRILCRLALFVLAPSDSAARAFEAACSPLLPAAQAWAWAGKPRAELLPRLAARLYPPHEVYFKEELAMAIESVPHRSLYPKIENPQL